MNSMPISNIPIRAPDSAWSRLGYHLPWLVLAASLATTYLLWQREKHYAVQELQSEFDFRVNETNGHIEQRMAAYQQVLRSTAALFTQSHHVTRKEFRDFIQWQRLDQAYPGIQGVAFVPLIPASQKQRYIDTVRNEGFPNFAIKPEGKRELYSPVTYIEPFSGANLRAFGHDPFSDPARRTAMEMARDGNDATITRKLTLVQESETNPQPGFMMYFPLYMQGAAIDTVAQRRANLIGWVSVPFRMNDLMTGLLAEHSAILDFEIYDEKTTSHEALLFDSDNSPGSRNHAQFQAINAIRVACHSWTVAARSQAEFEKRIDQSQSRLIATLGIASSFLLALFVWQLVNSRSRAFAAARQMNRELLESRTRYQQMFDDAASIAFLINPENGHIVDANNAAALFWGYSIDELRTMSIFQINVATEEEVSDAIRQVHSNKVQHFEWRHQLRNGAIRDVEVYASPVIYKNRTLVYSILHDITERKHAEAALRESEDRFRSLFEHSPVAYQSLDAANRYLDVNDKLCEMLGYSRTELLGMHFEDLWDEPSKLAFSDKFGEFICHQQITSELALIGKNGASITVMLSGRAQRDHDGNFVRSHCILIDVTEQRKREEMMRLSATVFNTLDEAIVITDTDNKILTVNPAFTKITGYSHEEVVGKNPNLLSSGKHLPEFYEELWETLTATGSWHGEIWNRGKPGNLYVEQISIHTVHNDQGQLSHHVAAFSDVSERKAMDEHVRHLAHYDLLTDLPNRVLITDRLRHTLVKAKRDKVHMALMFLDLDKFKPVNDRLGHAIGDLLLQDVAKRLRKCVRESDTVARIGGDEFVVLLPEINETADALRVADKILFALNLPFSLQNHQLHISASIGIAIYPEHGEDDEILTRNADIAMYFAKAQGRNHAQVFSTELQKEPPQS